VPAWNEERIIVETVRSALGVDYPHVSVIVVDDGSTDATLKRLAAAFKLAPAVPTYHPVLATSPVRSFYSNPRLPNLLVVHKKRGGKPDALNTGINLCRTPYFCCLDADCILERDSILRLMDPILSSPRETIVSGGIVRIINGSSGRNGQIVNLGLPRTSLERFQVVEYLRSFLTGRTGWALLGGTVIVSGALALFQHKAVMEVGGFSSDTVTEDMDLIVTLRRWAVDNHREIELSFISDPVCWTECPASLAMLGRQRRRWQLGLCQTLRKHRSMLFRRRYGMVGLFSLPFHLYVEALGTVVEFLGYLLVPLSFFGGLISSALLILFMLLGLAYGGFLSVGAVLLEEMTYRRYPKPRDLLVLLVYGMLENIGYRQLILFFRIEGTLKFLVGSHRWEKVMHRGESLTPAATDLGVAQL
jgi:cellulose synthase/poly-beta-1,6-N-acetylglucosamine synthase-like glycosyltransferase